jgi:hypothetical protein
MAVLEVAGRRGWRGLAERWDTMLVERVMGV